MTLFFGLLPVCALGASLTYDSFLSAPIALRPGEVANTDPLSFVLQWIPSPAAIRYFSAEVVDESGVPVPITEIYVHHWLIYKDPFLFQRNSGPCLQSLAGTNQFFGLGAELKGTIYDLPYPYAITTVGSEIWAANLHFIRTDQNVSDVQRCIECHCPDGTPEHPRGNIGCSYNNVGCQHGNWCWSAGQAKDAPAKVYYLKYTIGHEPVTLEIVSVDVYLLDITATHTVDCLVEYQIPASPHLNILESIQSFARDLEIVTIASHQHIGGENLTLSKYNPATRNFEDVCTNRPIYGTDRENEGYVTGISVCTFNTPVHLPADNPIRLRSIYSNRTIPGGHPEHEGVMGLVWMAAVSKRCEELTCTWDYRGRTTPGTFGREYLRQQMPSIKSAMDLCENIDACAGFAVDDSNPNAPYFHFFDIVVPRAPTEEKTVLTWDSYAKLNCSCVHHGPDNLRTFNRRAMTIFGTGVLLSLFVVTMIGMRRQYPTEPIIGNTVLSDGRKSSQKSRVVGARNRSVPTYVLLARLGVVVSTVGLLVVVGLWLF